MLDINKEIKESAIEIDEKKEAALNGVFSEKSKLSEIDKQVYCIDCALYSTIEERIKNTGVEGQSGHWEGERGNSVFIPSAKEAVECLKLYELKGINYIDGIPDFFDVAEYTVVIDNMSEYRLGAGGNFEQANAKVADEWNQEGRMGRYDWKARDVELWRTKANLTWHERNDMKTMDLVRNEIHSNCKHLGGCAECRKRDFGEETFDDE